MRCVITLCLLFCCLQFSYAQQTLSFAIVPQASFVRVDGRVLDLRRERSIELAPGRYVVELWAPRFTILTDTIEVISGQDKTYAKGLRQLAPDFEDYRQEERRYNTARIGRTALKGVALLTTGAFTYTAIRGRRSRLSGLRDEASTLLTEYENGVVEGVVLGNRERYEAVQDKYADARTTHWLVTAGFAGAAALTTYCYIKLRKKHRTSPLQKPVYESPNPFLEPAGPATGYRGWQPGTATTPIGLTLTF